MQECIALHCKTRSNNEFPRNIKIKIEKQERSCEAMRDTNGSCEAMRDTNGARFKKTRNFYLAWTFLNSGLNLYYILLF